MKWESADFRVGPNPMTPSNRKAQQKEGCLDEVIRMILKSDFVKSDRGPCK